ncbi:Gfo/Idh/MocA family protein [Microbacterium ulmi]|uniref:Gfo/Idh/MocA family oxidoreductase n=1 Tax=Microbacterium ulmi TaxID=179095 RepID=A0A7Y2PYZ1_9MICO|nr:Gfo/Idh/MocA family oxidoreductase [Microbacterium ulmi]NII69962.1 putative dehydrogenase [Microbacterium ulmi]NNH03881.1 Gfo/Idh/MocA family oxidoreductase [Microbacterium ulmi]
MSDYIRWGILGAGAIARQEMGPTLLASSRSRLAAIASRRQDAATELASELGGVRALGSYRALVEDPDIDAVYIALPNSEHREWSLAALAAGKHVLCEKPLGLRAADVQEMTDAARTHGRVLLEALMWRYSPRVRRILELLADDAIGDVRHVRASYAVRSRGLDDPQVAASTFRFSSALGGGALADLGCYCTDALLLFADGEPSDVTASRTALPGLEVETTVTAALDFGSATGHLFATMETAGGSEVEVFGTKGRIRLPVAFRTRRTDAPLTLDVTDRSGTLTRTEWPFESQYVAQVEHFADVVLDGAPPLVAPAQSLRTARALDAVRGAWASPRPGVE